MDLIALRFPAPNPSTSSYPSTSIPSATSSISSASSSVPSVSATSPSFLTASPSSFSFMGLLVSSSLLLCLSLYIRLCPTGCVTPSMPASRLTQSYRFIHAIFAWYPAALITSLARYWRSFYPITMGSAPGLLSRAIRRYAISARWASQVGEDLAIQ